MTRSGLILDNRYRLDERIAAGGVGQVWQATDLLLERPVAVKVLRPEYADHPETLNRFRKEARHAGALNNAHVAQVYDYGPSGPDGSPYLVMEYVDGSSLADALAVDPIEPVRALDIIAQAADGLAAAHEAGLVHRDVKPGNILISKEGLVKVTDFGIAHAAGQAPVTGPGLVMGTTQYMAPERIAGSQGTAASDVYALGIVLHECLTGVPPHDGTPAEVMAAHLYMPLPPLPAGTPPEVEDLVARLTVKDPAQRISDARELSGLAAMLRDSVSGVPHVAQARGAAYPAGEGSVPRAGALTAEPVPALAGIGTDNPARRSGGSSPGMLSPGGLSGFSVNGSAGGNTPPRVPLPPGSPQQDQPKPTQRRRVIPIAAGAAAAASAGLIALFASGAFNGAPAANQRPVPAPASVSPAGAPAMSPRASSGPAPASQPAGVTSPAAAVPAAAVPVSSGGRATTPSEKPSASSSSYAGSGASASPTYGGAPPTAPPSSVPSETPSAQPTTQDSTPASPPASTPTPSPARSVCVLIVCL